MITTITTVAINLD